MIWHTWLGIIALALKPNSWKSESVPSSPVNFHQVICRAVRGGAKHLELVRSPLKDQSGNSTPLQRGARLFCLWRATISIKLSNHCLCNCSKLTPSSNIHPTQFASHNEEVISEPKEEDNSSKRSKTTTEEKKAHFKEHKKICSTAGKMHLQLGHILHRSLQHLQREA